MIDPNEYISVVYMATDTDNGFIRLTLIVWVKVAKIFDS